MSVTYLGYFFIALLIGCGGPIQAGINSTLAKTLGHPLLGAITNTMVATLAILIVILLFKVQLPTFKSIASAPWWAWCGGIIGAFSVFGALNYAPKMGAAAYVSVTVLGIVSASLILDHFGAIGFQKYPITFGKLFGASMVVCGMTIIQFQR
jgi:transporter family-2 protein